MATNIESNILKNELINQRPGEEDQIRQILNKTKFNEAVQNGSSNAPQKKSSKKSNQKCPVESHTKSIPTNGPGSELSLENIAGQDTATKPKKKKQTVGDAEIPKIIKSFCLPSANQQVALLPRMTIGAPTPAISNLEELRNAVLCCPATINASDKAIPQYALLGSRHDTIEVGHDSRIFLNTNIPFSVFICGLQGSGKSHTVSCMIENFLIPSPMLGVLQRPLSALAFHYAEHTSPSSFRPSELAYVAKFARGFSAECKGPSVEVFVSPSSYPSLRDLYSKIPGVCVRPFKIHPQTLTVGMMLALMSVNQDQSPPLYISQVINILRQISSTGSGKFEYEGFRRRLRDTKFDLKQTGYLQQRLDLLESFLDLSGKSKKMEFAGGRLTIIDLSCPFMDENTACVLFRVGMTMLLDSEGKSGKVVVVDEAHKFMRDTPAAKDLTEALLCIIREQRHYGARVIISTQEPTISPRLIDLCSLTIVHRFSSPSWFESLKRHIVIETEDGTSAMQPGGLFDHISRLRTGEALVFAAAATIRLDASENLRKGKDPLQVSVRQRVTWDGGRSVVCI